MSNSVVLKGADVKVYINETLVKEVESISYKIDYGVTEIYGIDSVVAQEITTTKVTVSGSLSLLMMRGQGGLAQIGGRPKISQIMEAPYVAIKVIDRSNDMIIMYTPQCQISDESFQLVVKTKAKKTVSFRGIILNQVTDLT